MIYKRSSALFAEAQVVIPGGVNSPVRAFKAVGGDPIFVEKAKGAYLFDVDGNQLIDYINSWGPMILGHAYTPVVDAVIKKAQKGTSFGMPTEIETEIAALAVSMVPNIEKIRFVNSGTEACMSAVRLARGYTNKDKIIKFAGCYHGHSDSLLVKAGSGALTMGVPTSPGVPVALAEHTITLNYNDIDQVRETFSHIGHQIACIIVEPVAGNMNCIPPVPGFLQGLREVCDEYESVLVFDEVMTGFRVSLGGAQGYYGVTPDLTTLGKVIGGGLPVGAFGGKREIMEQIAPLGPIYQAGTLSGNPVSMAAGLATLNLISQPGFHDNLSQIAVKLVDGLSEVARSAGIPLTTNQVGGMFGFFFSDEESITSFNQVTKCNVDRFKLFFHGMLEQGVYLAPSAYETGFVSSAHDDEAISKTLDAAEKVLSGL
mgnify:CR=1 FL=1